MTPGHVDRATETIRSAAVFACQLEGPLDTFAYGLRKARQLGVTTLLDPAPAVPLPETVYQNTDIITPNESEVQLLTGIYPATLRDAAKAGRILMDRGVKTAIVKLGERGCLCMTADDEQYVPAVHVETKDVTGGRGRVCRRAHGLPWPKANHCWKPSNLPPASRRCRSARSAW